MSHPPDVRLAGTRADLLHPPRAGAGPVALVPTMGALHEGHAALVRAARESTDGPVVVSVFVNPLQFGPGEDLDRYPRTPGEDLDLCAREGADVMFAPSVEEMYPVSTGSTAVPVGGPVETPGASTGSVTVDPGPLGAILEGAARPTHFRGVLTVVAKLFALVRPELAFFGEKDYQQLVLVRKLARELCLGVDVRGVGTVRDSDGLALSSRNRYLDRDQRHAALALSRSLRRAQECAADGAAAAQRAAVEVISGEPGIELDYLAVRAPDLSELTSPDGPAPPGGRAARILVAARVGATRLIDNMPLQIGAPATAPEPAVEGVR